MYSLKQEYEVIGEMASTEVAKLKYTAILLIVLRALPLLADYNVDL